MKRIETLEPTFTVAPAPPVPWPGAQLSPHTVLPLARAFLGAGARLTVDAERALLGYSWPGNVRELRNVLQRAALLVGDAPINAAALNLPAVLPARSDEPVLDRATIDRVLADNNHVVAQAARQLGISRQALYRRMEKLGIKESPGR